MPYLQAATNNIFGFQPTGGSGRTNLFPISSTEATQVLAGDVCVWTTISTVKAALGASTGQYAGVAAQTLSTASYSATTLSLLLYDDPDQEFACAVTTSAGMGSTQYGKVFLIITTATGTGIPSTSLSAPRSKMALGVAGSSGGIMKMVGLHPIEFGSTTGAVLSSAVGTPQKFIVRPDVSAVSLGPITT